MYWNEHTFLRFNKRHKINYNMRCIETMQWVSFINLYWDKLQHEMYWNLKISAFVSLTILDKLQHEMYWNIRNWWISGRWYVDKLQHEMYWNLTSLTATVNSNTINYNMRCIETCRCFQNPVCEWQINYNMRCIETKPVFEIVFPTSLINYNMRCIETRYQYTSFLQCIW